MFFLWIVAGEKTTARTLLDTSPEGHWPCSGRTPTDTLQPASWLAVSQASSRRQMVRAPAPSWKSELSHTFTGWVGNPSAGAPPGSLNNALLPGPRWQKGPIQVAGPLGGSDTQTTISETGGRWPAGKTLGRVRLGTRVRVRKLCDRAAAYLADWRRQRACFRENRRNTASLRWRRFDNPSPRKRVFRQQKPRRMPESRRPIVCPTMDFLWAVNCYIRSAVPLPARQPLSPASAHPAPFPTDPYAREPPLAFDVGPAGASSQRSGPGL